MDRDSPPSPKKNPKPGVQMSKKKHANERKALSKRANEILEALRFLRAARETYKQSVATVGVFAEIPPPLGDVSIESFVEWDRVIDKVLYPPSSPFVSEELQ